MNVRGFQDTFVHADQLTVADGLSIKIPKVEGYAILKTHAWLDRSAYGEYRDGPDLALAVHWLFMDADLLYHEANIWALELHDHELRQASAALLGASMRQGLSVDASCTTHQNRYGERRSPSAQLWRWLSRLAHDCGSQTACGGCTLRADHGRLASGHAGVQLF